MNANGNGNGKPRGNGSAHDSTPAPGGNGHGGNGTNGNGHADPRAEPGTAGTTAPGTHSDAPGAPEPSAIIPAAPNAPQNAADAGGGPAKPDPAGIVARDPVPVIFADGTKLLVPPPPPGETLPTNHRKMNGGKFRKGHKRGGRPRKDLDENLVMNMAVSGCTYTEIARATGVDPETIARRYASQIDMKRAEYAWQIRERQNFEAVINGNPTMLIWLGKNVLGQKDRTEVSAPGGGAAFVVNIANVNYDRFASEFASVAENAAGQHGPGGNGRGDALANGD